MRPPPIPTSTIMYTRSSTSFCQRQNAILQVLQRWHPSPNNREGETLRTTDPVTARYAIWHIRWRDDDTCRVVNRPRCRHANRWDLVQQSVGCFRNLLNQRLNDPYRVMWPLFHSVGHHVRVHERTFKVGQDAHDFSNLKVNPNEGKCVRVDTVQHRLPSTIGFGVPCLQNQAFRLHFRNQIKTVANVSSAREATSALVSGDFRNNSRMTAVLFICLSPITFPPVTLTGITAFRRLGICRSRWMELTIFRLFFE